MADANNQVQLAREEQIFIALETTRGTFVHPTGGQAVRVVGDLTPDQKPGYTDSEEKADTRSAPDQFVDAYPAGSISIKHYARIAAAAGSLPEHDLLYMAALGARSQAASHVDYTLAKYKPSLSVLLAKADMVFGFRGLVVDQMTLPFAKKGAMTFQHACKFMQMAWVGKTIYGAGMAYDAGTKIITLPTSPGDDHDKYVGGFGLKVKIWDASANGGAGAWLTDGTNAYFDVTAKSIAGNSITLGAAITGGWTPAAGDKIVPYVPTVTLPTTRVIESRSGKVYRTTAGTNALAVLSSQLQLQDNIGFLEEEITDSGYPEDYSEGKRVVLISSGVYFRSEDLKYYGSADRKATYGYFLEGTDPITAPARTNGMQVSVPKALGTFPTPSGNTEQQLKVDYRGFYSAAYEDELKIRFGDLTA